MLCPACRENLEKSLFYGVEVDYCQQCLGVWFEEDELRQAKDEKDRDLRWLDINLWKDETNFEISAGQRLCPSCRMPLYQVGYGESGIFVDVCNLCHGIWLDRGEFRKIIAYLKGGVEFKILYNYLKTLRQEAWEIFAGPESFKDEVLDFLAVFKILNYKLVSRHLDIARIISQLPK